MNKSQCDLKEAQPFLVNGKGVVYGVDIGNGFVSFYDLISQKIEMCPYNLTSECLGSFNKSLQLEGFDEFNIGASPVVGKSRFKVDGYCESGNSLIFEITNKELCYGIEIILKTHCLIEGKLIEPESSKIKTLPYSFSRSTFQVSNSVSQYLSKMVDTPSSNKKIKELILPGNLIAYR